MQIRTYNLDNEVTEILSNDQDNVKANIIFIHGFTSSIYSHVEFENANSFKDLNYFSINLSGHKINHKNDNIDEIDFDSLVEEIISFINNKKLTNVILIGHSLGGALCLAVQNKIPFKILGLILVAPLNPMIFKTQIGIRYFLSILFNNKKFLKKILSNNEQVKNILLNEYIDFEINRFLNHKFKYLLLGLKIIDKKLMKKINSYYTDVEIPTLVLLGEEDKVIRYRKTNKYLKKINNKNIKVFKIKNARHLVFMDNFAEYNTLVWKFINKLLLK